MNENGRMVQGQSSSSINSKMCWDARESQEHGVDTMQALESLGFSRELAVNTHADMAINMGEFVLTALFCLTSRFRYEIIFSGHHITSRIATMVEFEMPVLLDSDEVAIAWLTWMLETYFKNRIEILTPFEWLEVGRQNFHLLPWVKKRIAYDLRESEYQASPRCCTCRTDTRTIVRTISNKIKDQGHEFVIRLRFDGEVLKIDTPEIFLAIPAQGEAWKNNFQISASAFLNVPRRFLRDYVEWAIFEERLHLNRLLISDTVIKEDISAQLQISVEN